MMTDMGNGKISQMTSNVQIVEQKKICLKRSIKRKKEGMTVKQLRDIGRIAAVIHSVAKVLNG